MQCGRESGARNAASEGGSQVRKNDPLDRFYAMRA
jgi:hypothetical protein